MNNVEFVSVGGSAAAWRPSLLDRARSWTSGLKHRFFPDKSNLEHHAERELARLMGDADGDDMQSQLNKHILRMVRTFSREGHSGFSAGYAVSILQDLLRFQPITPLTGDDDEWVDVGAMSGEPCWQNSRCSHVFKGADGRAYDIDGRVFVEPSGTSFTGQGSRVFVQFPHTPSTEYVKVNEDGEPLEGPSREDLAAEMTSHQSSGEPPSPPEGVEGLIERLRLQRDARLHDVPTPLTYELRIGVSGEGPRAYDWADKPHRLVYDACREIERLAALLSLLREGGMEGVVQTIKQPQCGVGPSDLTDQPRCVTGAGEGL